MKQIAAAKFKQRCLALLHQVDQDGIVITRHGKPVAKLIPYSGSASLIGSLEGKVVIKGDILSTVPELGASTRAQEQLRGLRGRVRLSIGPAALRRDRP